MANGGVDGAGDTTGRSDVVKEFVHFQQTGQGFDAVWRHLQPMIAEFARRNLRRLGVPAGVARNAVDDIVNSTAVRLLGLAEPRAGGRFDPARRARPGVSGLRGWLWRVVQRQAADWRRKEAGRGRLKIVPEGDLEWNEMAVIDDGSSITKQVVAKIVRPDLLPILYECINQLADPEVRQVIRLRLDEDLSQREIAERMKVAAATVNRRLKAACKELRPLLERRGVDAAWLAA